MVPKGNRAKKRHLKKSRMPRPSDISSDMSWFKKIEQKMVKGKTVYSAFIGRIKGQGSLTNQYDMDKADRLITSSEGCHHMISDMNPTSEVKAVSRNVLIANGDRIPVEGI
ncbi:hypothetical protein Bca101_026349 [Brassica carinata]